MAQDPSRTFSDQVLAETPGRALKFIGYASRNKIVRAALAKRKFGLEDIKAGWKLFFLAVGYPPAEYDPGTDPAVSEALAFLDGWDEPNFAIYEVVLKRHHPEAVAIVFKDLQPGRGAESIVSVTTFLDRVDELEKGPHASAVETLAKRGLTPDVRAQLRSLIDIAKGTQVALDGISDEDVDAIRREALIDLKLWYDEGSTIIKNSGLSRYHLINLGLARRKKGGVEPA
jgi:hypothetical protein